MYSMTKRVGIGERVSILYRAIEVVVQLYT
jgi:hypothetical protein